MGAPPAIRSVARGRAIGIVALGLALGSCGGPPELHGTAFVANAVSRDVTVHEAPSFERVARIRLPAVPRSIHAEPGARRLWTTNQLANSVTVIDADRRRVLRTVRVCRGPTQVAFWVPVNRAYVVCNDGYLVGIDTRTLERVGRRQAVGFAPYAFVPGPNEHLWTANRGSNDISEIDPGTGRLIGHYPAAPAAYGLAFSADHRYAFVTSKQWNATTVVATDDKEILGAIKVGKDPALVVASEDQAYVANKADGTISVISTRTFQELRRITVGRHPESLALGPDGRVLLVTTEGSLVVLDTEASKVLYSVPAGQGPVSVALLPAPGRA